VITNYTTEPIDGENAVVATIIAHPNSFLALWRLAKHSVLQA
jgi:hypothetical protein